LKAFSNYFHNFKGKAKNRDIIKHVTFDMEQKELKYCKDIKDKKGEHYYVSFSLKLNNIENLGFNGIDETLINKIINIIEVNAPLIHKKKNEER